MLCCGKVSQNFEFKTKLTNTNRTSNYAINRNRAKPMLKVAFIMDTKLKYVRLKRYNEVIIFPCVIEHSTFKHLEPISAGFCYVLGDEQKVSCFGESYSLNLKSNIKEDTIEATKWVFGIDAMLKVMR